MPSSDPGGCVPEDFQFSQSSLRDFLECPRLFHLRYVQHRAWPGLISEPALLHERRMLQGAAFHRMVQQHLAGVPAERLTEMLAQAPARDDEDLRRWWQNYLDARPNFNGCGRLKVEFLVAVPLAGRRLVARYDLVALVPGGDSSGRLQSAVIFDWKTGGKHTSRSQMAAAYQTRVYRYVLAQGSARLNGGQRLQPEQIEMVYWFADDPGLPEVFSYSSDQCQEDDRTLRALISEICSRKADEFCMAPGERQCPYCVYRSLCDRGGQAGPLEALDSNPAATGLDGLDLAHVEEIAY